MEEGRGTGGHWSWLGVIAMIVAAGLCWLALEAGPATLAFGAAFCVLAAWAMFAPVAIRGVSRDSAGADHQQRQHFYGGWLQITSHGPYTATRSRWRLCRSRSR